MGSGGNVNVTTSISSKEVLSQPWDASIKELYELETDGDLRLDPDYQRNYVWNLTRASQLVESVLMKVPIPVIYLSEETSGKFLVIDGQQRLKSLFGFLAGKLEVYDERSRKWRSIDFWLNKLETLEDLNGLTYSELPKSLQKQFKASTLKVIKILKQNSPQLKYDIFERLNRGAVALSDQEVRNCIYHGSYNDLIKRLAANKDYLFVLGQEGPHKRMQDRELVLRFLAFYRSPYHKYTPPMKEFLNTEMRKHRGLHQEELEELEKLFKRSAELTRSIFGKNAFRRFAAGTEEDHDGHWEKKINKGLHDMVMWGFTIYDKHQVTPHADAIREELMNLMTQSPKFIDSISGTGTDSRKKVYTKFSRWQKSLEHVLSVPTTEARLFSHALKERLYKQNKACKECGQKIMDIDDAQVDHKEQYWRGGHTIPKNARLLHRFCNLARKKKES
jgi:hypothetical protein